MYRLKEANCATTDPDIFYPNVCTQKASAAAKLICSHCFVLEECREEALKDPSDYGIRAGMTPKERESLL